jgi:flagellar hook-associated protein 2
MTSSLSSTYLSASSVNTPTMQSAGVGSGLDVNSIVSQLVSAAQTPQQTIITNQQNATNTKISALGSLSSLLGTLQSSITILTSSTTGVTQLTAQSGNTSSFTAAASGNAVPASYNVQVLALAQASKIATADYSSASSTVGDGTVTIGVGTNSFNVTLAPGNDSLTSLVSAINNAPDNKGVSASLITDSGGVRLMLTAQQTGNAGALTLSSADSNGASFISTSVVQPAKQAHIQIDGFDYYGDSNTVSNAISGVTLSLQATSASASPLTLSYNQQAAANAVQAFVTAYNAVARNISTQAGYNSITQTAGPLLANPLVQSLTRQLGSIVGSAYTGTGGSYSVLSQVGISLNSDGTLSVDSTKLNNALSADPTSVQKLFASSGGAGTAMTSALNGFLGAGGSTGSIAAASNNLQQTLTNLGQQQTALAARMKLYQGQLYAQYSALDKLMSSMKSTSTFLTQQFNAMNGSSSSSSGK